ncbi:Hypothetical protein MELLADRAFT_105634 [Melampsora larici-populina 98AG31]|uniref:ubiquitinyl hydrolase 1 n=1 Tax=Melampsora larici-populina (strain 98AG31 / pathotype 3-4-7) TaxID=747676 RepID=F4RIV3_MELLP|nr:Hypothetical protein MELLADRAFT_105634 [Melampsora larici-populina 98AG31]EGG07766.1 Hypothetical protein MELLADRAFT_105634 [Melampsora larici-populina 98AG31]
MTEYLKTILQKSHETQQEQPRIPIVVKALNEIIELVNNTQNKPKVLSSRVNEISELDLSLKAVRSPFTSLMADRIGCATCGNSSAIRHQPADQFSFNVPMTPECQLEDCLKDFTQLELLDEYNCRRCSIIEANRRMKSELDQLSSQPTSISKDKKKRIKELKKLIDEIQSVLKNNDEHSIFSQKLEAELFPIMSRATTKQTMFSRPPKALMIHLSRSSYYRKGQIFKNNCKVNFPEILIMDRFTTTYELNRRAETSISRHNLNDQTKAEHVYQLVSVVVHFGNHTSGHYITFRRVEEINWIKVSDEDVIRCEKYEVFGANPTILIYQRL